ncbi:hypothetical protein ACTWQB_13755 [Piscibacillus sp. B03]
MYLRSAIPQDAKMLTKITIKSRAYWGYSKEFIKNLMKYEIEKYGGDK